MLVLRLCLVVVSYGGCCGCFWCAFAVFVWFFAGLYGCVCVDCDFVAGVALWCLVYGCLVSVGLPGVVMVGGFGLTVVGCWFVRFGWMFVEWIL